MWETTVDGRPLHFRLSGINDQNFFMRDRETGSWWQQVTGVSMIGPLEGRKLALVPHDEISFATWKQEQPGGRVLKPDPRAAPRYAPANWEQRMANVPTVTPVAPNDPLAARELVLGITIGDVSKAYPVSKLAGMAPLSDTLGSTAIVIVLDQDRSSVRVFDRSIDGRALGMFASPDTASHELIDGETGSRWNFRGHAVSGPLAGRMLRKLHAIKDYWFDWKKHHPETLIY